MPGVLVIGYGNPLRSDDGLGWVAAQRLGEELTRRVSPTAVHPGEHGSNMVDREQHWHAGRLVEILALHQLTPELAEPLSQADLVIFIDAAESGVPGAFRCEPLLPAVGGRLFSHQVTPPTLLACAQELYGACPPAFALSITGETFGYGESLSTTVEERLPELLAKALDLMGT